jgi:hypothetical protein
LIKRKISVPSSEGLDEDVVKRAARENELLKKMIETEIQTEVDRILKDSRA